ncbi:MAG: DUF4271 domain-containing protein [Bacteroidales bacterium]|nr:DUF4271 domain-containing protein [Bacteroidales bacterium]
MEDSLNISAPDSNPNVFDTSLYGSLGHVVDSNIISQQNLSSGNNQKPSILIPNLNEAQNIKPIPIQTGRHDWLAGHILISLIFIAWANIYFNKRLKQVFKSFFSQRYQHMMTREGNLFKERISIALFLIFIISYSILIFLGVTRFIDPTLISFTGFKLYALILLSVLIVWIVKNLLLTLVGITFKNRLILESYLLTNFVFNVVSAIFLLPLLIFANFLPSDQLITISVFFVLSVFIYRILRQFFTSLNYKKFSWFNRILYLCTFEITPLLVLIKLIISRLG